MNTNDVKSRYVRKMTVTSHKDPVIKWPKHVLMSDLLKAMFARIGMSPVGIAVREKVKELEAA